jgi:hypothetical protein
MRRTGTSWSDRHPMQGGWFARFQPHEAVLFMRRQQVSGSGGFTRSSRKCIQCIQRVLMRRQFIQGKGVHHFAPSLARRLGRQSPRAVSPMQHDAPAKIRQREGLPVSSIHIPQQGKERLVLIDGQELTVGLRPSDRTSIRCRHHELADEGLVRLVHLSCRLSHCRDGPLT